MSTKAVLLDTRGRKHGSPYDRGDSDAYYGRSPKPHKWLDSMGCSRVELTDQSEIDEYFRGYRANPSGEKNY